MRFKRRQCGCEGWTHAETYRGWNPAAFLHRARLRKILTAVAGQTLPATGRIADFGCSDGFILEHLQRAAFPPERWSIHGFDANKKMLEAAAKRNLPRSTFLHVDLNHELPVGLFGEGFDVVTCFESFEHMGDWLTATRSVFGACKPGGLLLLSVPNETGVPGLVKFYARKIIDRSPYAKFFASAADERRYVRALLRGDDLGAFRDPAVTGWGEHLGFDIRRFESHLNDAFFASGAYRLLRRERNLADLGRLYLVRRIR